MAAAKPAVLVPRAPIIDRSEIRNAISTFSMSARPMNTILTFTNIDRHRKRKMVAAKPEVLVSCVLGVVDVGGCYNDVRRSGRHRKHRNIVPNLVSIYDENSIYKYFRLGGRHLAFPVSDDIGGCQTRVYRSGRHRKCRSSISNFASFYYRTRDTSTSGLAAAILCFRFTSKSDDVGGYRT
jgi:hypothetical protein